MPGEIGQVLNPKGVIVIQNENVQFNGIPESPFFYSFLNGVEEVVAQWELQNTRIGLGTRELRSFKTKKMNLWRWKGAISPELFKEIKLNSGESDKWVRRYEIFEL